MNNVEQFLAGAVETLTGFAQPPGCYPVQITVTPNYDQIVIGSELQPTNLQMVKWVKSTWIEGDPKPALFNGDFIPNVALKSQVLNMAFFPAEKEQ